MSWMWIVGLVILLQLATGCTIGAEQFRSMGGETPIPNGRWVRLIHRDEDPRLFWVMIVCQVVLMVASMLLS